jgi:hypothetical protein
MDGFSVERSFHTRPPLDYDGVMGRSNKNGQDAANSKKVVRFLGFGDQDWDEGPGASPTTASNCLRDALEAGYDDFLLHYGDISYAEGTVRPIVPSLRPSLRLVSSTFYSPFFLLYNVLLNIHSRACCQGN